MRERNEHLRLVDGHEERPRWKKALRMLFCLTLLAGLFLLLKQGEAHFRVGDIRIAGAAEYSREEILTAAGIAEGASIFFLQEGVVASRIEENLPAVKSASFSRRLPDQVFIELEMRTPAACLRSAEGYWLLDSAAVCFDYSAEPFENYPLVTGIEFLPVAAGSPIGCPVRGETLRNFLAASAAGEIAGFEEIDLTDKYNLVARAADEMVVWFGDWQYMEDKFQLVGQAIPHIAQNSQALLDVRSGKRLYLSGSVLVEEEEVEP